MIAEISILINRLESDFSSKTNVIGWGAPVPSFGNIETSTIATLGLNPSNMEFVDNNGNELEGQQRRFHTLNSLKIKSWQSAQDVHLDSIAQMCKEYFSRNPYNRWFKPLDYIISGTSRSYYFPHGGACHLDLIPYATIRKWGELSRDERIYLLQACSDILGRLIKESPIKFLVLNGQSVVENFENIIRFKLHKTTMFDWTLPRANGYGVIGIGYEGIISRIGDVQLKHPIYVLGYNHNIQSSFGVTKNVLRQIRNWISESINKHET